MALPTKFLVLHPIAYDSAGFRKESGEKVSLKELQTAGQSDEDVERLLAAGALEAA